MALGFIAILESAACDAVKFSGAAEGKFRARRRGGAVNLRVLRLSARQCGKFMDAAIAGTAVRRRNAIERVSKLAGTECRFVGVQ